MRCLLDRRPIKGDGIENANSMRSRMPLVQNETPSRYVLQELRE